MNAWYVCNVHNIMYVDRTIIHMHTHTSNNITQYTHTSNNITQCVILFDVCVCIHKNMSCSCVFTNNYSGEMKTGLNAIMGPTGSGKTT